MSVIYMIGDGAPRETCLRPGAKVSGSQTDERESERAGERARARARDRSGAMFPSHGRREAF
jgi:hypothetical protein